jgi:hypothetical protein
MLFEAVDETEGTKRTVTAGGLPELEGEIADRDRAAEIRNRILVEADDVLTRLRSDEIITEAQTDTAIVSPRQVNPAQVHAAEAALNRLRRHTDAAWWIAHADRSAADLLAVLMADPQSNP